MPTISDYLKYANLQMAAEAFLANDDGTIKGNIKEALAAGNGHASVFTQTEAEKFTDPVKGWTVLDQKANTGTGFSGTLFKNNQTNELVLSFRSTEFIDDAARDSRATNELEIKDTGWAWVSAQGRERPTSSRRSMSLQGRKTTWQACDIHIDRATAAIGNTVSIGHVFA